MIVAYLLCLVRVSARCDRSGAPQSVCILSSCGIAGPGAWSCAPYKMSALLCCSSSGSCLWSSCAPTALSAKPLHYHPSINRIGANLWRCLGATAIAYCHASASAGDDHDDGGLDDTVRSDFSPMLADLVILADLLRRTDPVRFQVRQPGRP